MDKEKGKGVNVIVSAKDLGNNGNGQTIGWLKVDDKSGCNGQRTQGGNEGNEECWNIEGIPLI